MRTALTRLLLSIATLALLVSVPARLRADDAVTNETPSLSDAVGDGLAKLKPFLDSKDWTGAIKLVDDLLKDAPADSYDQAFLLETKAKVLTMGNDYPAALAPLETSLAISDRHHFYTRQQTLDMLYFLSQLYYQQAEGTKSDHETQIGNYEKSIGAIRRWLALSPKKTADITEYYSRLLYSEAVAKDPSHPDPVLIKEASDEVEKVLRLSARPKESTYVFLLATIQQQQNYTKGAELLEYILSIDPKNKTYWQDLVTFYIVLAQNEKDPAKVRKYNIRAINTLERAQALGFLQTPRDNYLKFTFYYELGQYGVAAQVLHDGLMQGKIESDLDKWVLLSSAYQQINQDFNAIEVLKEAESRYPKNADIDLKIASSFASLDKGADALKYYKLSEHKDSDAKLPGNNPKNGLSKSQRSYLLLAMAYQAYELQEFDDAKVAVDKAVESAGGKPDHQLQVLKNAIDDAIKSRDANKKPNDL